MHLGSNMYKKTKEETLINTDENSEDDEITLQTEGTNSEPSLKIRDGLTQFKLTTFGKTPTGWTKKKLKLVRLFIKKWEETYWHDFLADDQ